MAPSGRSGRRSGLYRPDPARWASWARHRELGGTPEHRVDVGVDDLHDATGQLVGGSPRGRRRGRRPRPRPAPSRSRAVGDVVVEGTERVVDHRAVARPDGADLVRLGEGVQPVEGVEVGAELAVRVRDHRGAAARARCRRSAPRARPAARTTASRRCGPGWRRRAAPGRRPRRRRRRRGPRSRAGTPGPARVRRSPTRSANSRAASEWSRWWWVSSTTRHRRRPARRRRRGVPRRAGPGRPRPSGRAPGSRSTQVLVPSRVIMLAFGASTHSRPLAERSRRPSSRPSRLRAAARAVGPDRERARRRRRPRPPG